MCFWLPVLRLPLNSPLPGPASCLREPHLGLGGPPSVAAQRSLPRPRLPWNSTQPRRRAERRTRAARAPSPGATPEGGCSKREGWGAPRETAGEALEKVGLCLWTPPLWDK